jgi:hypothetical protein
MVVTGSKHASTIHHIHKWTGDRGNEEVETAQIRWTWARHGIYALWEIGVPPLCSMQGHLFYTGSGDGQQEVVGQRYSRFPMEAERIMELKSVLHRIW